MSRTEPRFLIKSQKTRTPKLAPAFYYHHPPCRLHITQIWIGANDYCQQQQGQPKNHPGPKLMTERTRHTISKSHHRYTVETQVWMWIFTNWHEFHCKAVTNGVAVRSANWFPFHLFGLKNKKVKSNKLIIRNKGFGGSERIECRFISVKQMNRLLMDELDWSWARQKLIGLTGGKLAITLSFLFRPALEKCDLITALCSRKIKDNLKIVAVTCFLIALQLGSDGNLRQTWTGKRKWKQDVDNTTF